MDGHEDEEEHRQHDEDPEQDDPLLAEGENRALEVIGIGEIHQPDADREQDRRDDGEHGSDHDRDEDEDFDEADQRELPVGERVVDAAAQRVEDASSHSVFRR
jgi:hypothetical protein